MQQIQWIYLLPVYYIKVWNDQIECDNGTPQRASNPPSLNWPLSATFFLSNLYTAKRWFECWDMANSTVPITKVEDFRICFLSDQTYWESLINWKNWFSVAEKRVQRLLASCYLARLQPFFSDTSGHFFPPQFSVEGAQANQCPTATTNHCQQQS